MRSALDMLGPSERALLRRVPNPGFVEPMKATLTDKPFSDERWVFERKLDGVRCLAAASGGEITLYSRTGRRVNNTYPELVEALGRSRAADFLVDGELVAFEHGITSFARLQRRMQLSDPEAARRSGVPVHLYLFDLLHLDGHEATQLPVRSRKRLLRRALSIARPVHYLPHRNGDGEALFEQACKRGLEGLIAKRADSPYAKGPACDGCRRAECAREQELVIGGFTAPRGSRSDFGALLVGYYEDGVLRYAGKVGTGFDQRTLKLLGSMLRALECDRRPFADVHPTPRGTRWTEPRLVAQIAFSEWTRDGRLRHPRYRGLRDDKPAREVVRERPS